MWCQRGVGGHSQAWIPSLHIGTADSFLTRSGSWSPVNVALSSLTCIPICKATSGPVVPFMPYRSHFVVSKASGEEKICETKSLSTSKFHAAISFLVRHFQELGHRSLPLLDPTSLN